MSQPNVDNHWRYCIVKLIWSLLFQIIFASNILSQKKKSTPTVSTAISSYSAGGQYVMLTFDNGPHSIITNRLLDTLREKNVSATFFVQGFRAMDHPHIIKRMSEEGHEVASRGWNNIAFTSLRPDDLLDQIGKVNDIISNSTGLSPKLIRPPNGKTNNEVNKLIETNTKMKIILWSLDSGKINDLEKEKQIAASKKGKVMKKEKTKISKEIHKGTNYVKNNDNANYIVSSDIMIRNIMESVTVGDIIYFKDGNPDLLVAVPLIIDYLHSKGFELLTVSDMLSFPDDQPH